MLFGLLTAAVAAVTLGMIVTAQQPAMQGTRRAAGTAPRPQPADAPSCGARPQHQPRVPTRTATRCALALKTGHVSNYDETKTGTYTLPDPLMTSAARPVRDANAWRYAARGDPGAVRDEHLRSHPTDGAEGDVAGRGDRSEGARRRGGRKKIVGAVGPNADGPRITVTLTTPANASKPVPVILLVNFGGGPPPPPGTLATRGPGFNAHADPALADEILARGWGYATVGYADIQPDRANDGAATP